jgi:hypothetical protein
LESQNGSKAQHRGSISTEEEEGTGTKEGDELWQKIKPAKAADS